MADRFTAQDVTAVILAGGRASRMGGADKGWVEWRGMPLIEHALRSITPQVRRVRISANRHLDRYAALGVAVLPDEQTDFSGPLAGIAAALAVCETPLLCTLPVDTPGAAPDYVARMLAALNQRSECLAAVALAHENRPDGDSELRDQWTHLLLHRDLSGLARAQLTSGQCKLQSFAEHPDCGLVRVRFLEPHDAQCFVNFNMPNDLLIQNI